MRGKFITFEGIDKSGKTTQLMLLKEWLEGKGIEVVVTREPGGTPLGERIRDILLDASLDICPRAELLLYLASRAQNVVDVILPSLEAGRWVLCDRFGDSSVAYQGFGRGLVGAENFWEIESWGRFGVAPDLTIVLDIPVEEAFRRKGKSVDRIELEEIDFFRRVREGYLELARMFPRRVKIVDGRFPKDWVFEKVKALILPMLVGGGKD